MEHKFGTKEIVFGPMCCGKSIELIRRIKMFEHYAHAANARKPDAYQAVIFKPVMDLRKFSEAPDEDPLRMIYSRLGAKISGNIVPIKHSTDILQYFNSADFSKHKFLIAIDEVQLLDSGIISVSDQLVKKGAFVLLVGLDYNFRGEYFQFSDFNADMGDLIDSVPTEYRVHLMDAKCNVCGADAIYSQRMKNNRPVQYCDALVKIGYDYEPRCTKHFEIPGKDEFYFVRFLVKKYSGNSLNDLKLKANLPEFDDIIERMAVEKVIRIEHDKVFFLKSKGVLTLEEFV